MEVGAGEKEVPERVVAGEVRAVVTEAGDQPIQRALGEAGDGVGGDDGGIDRFGSEGERGGVPDGVDDDVLDGREGPVAVASDEEAAARSRRCSGRG